MHSQVRTKTKFGNGVENLEVSKGVIILRRNLDFFK